MGLFEVLATDTTQAEQTEKRAKLAVETRVQDRFSKILEGHAGVDLQARIELISADMYRIAQGVAEEYGFDNVEELYKASMAVLSGGHAADCDCGFCKNKGKLPGMESEDEGDEKESSVKQSFDYPSVDGGLETEQADGGVGGPIGKPLDEAKKGDNDDELGGPIGENASGQKGASVDVSPRGYVEFPWDHVASEVKIASFCDCDCEGCKDGGGHCESAKCIETKRTEAAPLKQESKVAADVEDGDSYQQERVDLPAADSSGLGSEGSPKIDKSQVPGGMAGNDGGLKPIDVPSNQHPVEQQDLGVDTPDYWKDLPGPSETGKQVDADTPMQPEHNVAPNTDTWSGTEGQANPVTSKWLVLPPEAE